MRQRGWEDNMKIGIIGKGKMGMDIFLYFMEYPFSLVLICHKQEAVEALTAKIRKKYEKKAARGIITNEECEKRCAEIVISADYNELSLCDIVIETVVEDLSVKQSIFECISKIVSDECILASNTSSLNLEDIFQNTYRKERCMGLHFFFPVKIIETVEVNCTDVVKERFVNGVVKLLKDSNKRPIILPPKGNLVLSKIISTMVCYAHLIYREGYLTFLEIDAIFKKNIMMFGAFELIDSTGFLIILRCFEQFRNDRYMLLYDPVAADIYKLEQLGFGGNNEKGGFISFEEESNNVPAKVFTNEEERLMYIEKCIQEIKAVIINDIANMYNNGLVLTKDFPQIVADTLGYSENPQKWFDEYGINKIKEILGSLYSKNSYSIFEAENYSIYEN